MFNFSRITLSILIVGACLVASEAAADPTILDGNEQSARTSVADTIFYDNEFPILNVRNVNGEAVLVEGPEIEDHFRYSTTATEVLFTIQPPSGDSIEVTAITGPTWYEDSVGNWEATFPMPSPGNQIDGTFLVELGDGDGDDDGDPNGSIIIIRPDGP